MQISKRFYVGKIHVLKDCLFRTFLKRAI